MQMYSDIRIYCLIIVLSLMLDPALSQVDVSGSKDAQVDPCGTHFVCPALILIPDPTDCRVRYECSGLNLTRLLCPTGQEYHSILQLCVTAGRAACLKPCPDGSRGIQAAFEQGNVQQITVLPGPDPEEDTLHGLGAEVDVSLDEEQTYIVDPCAGEFNLQCRKVTTTEYYVFPSPTDCIKYYQCVNGFVYERECPVGTLFNKGNNRCVHALTATCQKCPSTTEKVPETTTTPRSHGSDLTDLDPCSSTLEDDCSSLQGIDTVPDSEDCTQYYVCSNKQLDVNKCDGKKRFDDVSRSCKPAGQAICFSCLRQNSPVPPNPSTEIPIIGGLDPCISNLVEACAGHTGVTLVPDIHNCDKYYECRDKVLTNKNCKRKETFDQNSLACTDSSQGVCFGEAQCPSDEIHPCQPSKAIKNACRGAEYFSRIPDPEDCGRYLECKRGNINQKRCHTKLNFDINQRECVATADAICYSCKIIDPCSSDIDEQCKLSGQSFDFVDISTCNAYYRCKNGELDSRICPNNEHFDRLENMCKPEAEADCSNICSTGNSEESTPVIDSTEVTEPAPTQPTTLQTVTMTADIPESSAGGSPATMVTKTDVLSTDSPLLTTTGSATSDSDMLTGGKFTATATSMNPFSLRTDELSSISFSQGMPTLNTNPTLSLTQAGSTSHTTVPVDISSSLTPLTAGTSAGPTEETTLPGTNTDSGLTMADTTLENEINGNTTAKPSPSPSRTAASAITDDSSAGSPSMSSTVDLTGSSPGAIVTVVTEPSSAWSSSMRMESSSLTSGQSYITDSAVISTLAITGSGDLKTTSNLAGNSGESSTSYSSTESDDSTSTSLISSLPFITDQITKSPFVNDSQTISDTHIPTSATESDGNPDTVTHSSSTPRYLSTSSVSPTSSSEMSSNITVVTNPASQVITELATSPKENLGETDQSLANTTNQTPDQTQRTTASSTSVMSTEMITGDMSTELSSQDPTETTADILLTATTEPIETSSVAKEIEISLESTTSNLRTLPSSQSPILETSRAEISSVGISTFSSVSSGRDASSLVSQFTEPNLPSSPISTSNALSSSKLMSTTITSLASTTPTTTIPVVESFNGSSATTSSREVTSQGMRTTSDTDSSPTSTAWPTQGTGLTTSLPPLNPCFRMEPCTPGARVADPEDCDKYFQCEDPGRGMAVPGWKRRQCTRKFTFDRIDLKCVDSIKVGSRCQGPCPDPVHTLSLTTNDPREGHLLEFQCSYYEPMSSTKPPKFPPFRWSLNGLTILGGKGRIFINTTPVSPDGFRTSHLVFNPAKHQDSGVVACSILGSQLLSVESAKITVLARPRAFVYPMTSVVPRGGRVVLFCNASIPYSGHSGSTTNPTLNWYRNYRLITANNKGSAELITPLHGSSTLETEGFDDVRYSCEAVNAAGPSTRVLSYVFVYNASANLQFCEEEIVDGVIWPKSITEINVRSACPTGMQGEAVRTCYQEVDDNNRFEAKWGPPNLIGCVSENVLELLEQAKSIEGGIGSDNSSFIGRLVQEVEDTTNASKVIPPGDLSETIETVDLLNIIRQTNAEETNIMLDELQALVNIVSNLIDEMNEESWTVLKQQDMYKGVNLMRAVDGYADVTAAQTQQPTLMSVMSKNLMLQVECILKNETQTLNFPRRGPAEVAWLDNQDDQITLEKKTLDSITKKVPGRSMAFSSAYYKSLSPIIPESAEYGKTGSNILFLSIAKVKRVKNLDPPVQLGMQISQEYRDQNLTALCGFWDYSKGDRGNWSIEGCEVVYSNDSFAFCQCDHLTNFAILMSTHKPDDKHAVILGIITTVGLIISLVCLVLTIGLYCVMWKHIKSHHAVVLINLCIALIVANILFLAGVNQTKIEIVCTIIAVLLHYFYLAAFFIMLVEGIQLLLYVVFVFHVRRKRETTMLLICGWFLPAAVVGASLGITKMEGYGNELFCWLDIESGLIWAFVGPVLLIILINIIILIVVLRRASNSNANLRIENKKRHRIRSSLWNVVVITPIVGVAWLFGVFAVNDDTIAFQYIFAIFNSLQGLLIFIFHGIFNKRVQDKIQNSFRSRTTNSNTITLAFRSIWPGKKGRYSVKHPSTKRSRLKSDTSGKSGKKGKTSKNSKESSVPSSPGTEPPNLFALTSEKDDLNTLGQLREDNHMSWRNSNVYYSNGTSTFNGSEISNQTNSTIVNSTLSNGTDSQTANSASQYSGEGVSSTDIKGDVMEAERPEPKEPVKRVLSSTSC